MNFVDWFRENSPGFSGQLAFDESLSRSTYYRIGGPASILAIPRSLADLEWLARGFGETAAPFFVLGAGSNVLASDEGFKGVVIRATRLNSEVLAADEGDFFRVRVGASVVVSTLLRHAAKEGWGGLDFLTGIPGSMGGVARMNGGTHLGEAKDHLVRVEAFALLGSPRLLTYDHENLRFEYRRNLFLPEGSIVYAVEWRARKENPAQVKAKIDDVLARRKATQPIDYPSCGSVFKNPRESGLSAWQVVERLGLRGHRIGDAQFSEKHCNFILNLGRATARDVRALIELAKARALAELGISLREEVVYLGELSG